MTTTAAGDAEHLLRDADAHCLLPMAAREAPRRKRPPSTSVERTLDGCRIIVEGEESIGCMTTIAHPDHIWIDQLYISPGFQRKGIGSTALRTILSEAAVMGVPVRLSVIATNPALDFYRRHGLHTYNETPERRFMTT